MIENRRVECVALRDARVLVKMGTVMDMRHRLTEFGPTVGPECFRWLLRHGVYVSVLGSQGTTDAVMLVR